MMSTMLRDPEYELTHQNEGVPQTEEAELVPLGCPSPTRETISAFPRYRQSISSLPRGEQEKVARLARLIVNSVRPGCKPLLRVVLVGHADRDWQRGPAFETRISVERALELRKALIRSVYSLGRVAHTDPSLSSIQWEHRGVGAGQPVVQNPTIEQQRARNRRVDVILLSRPAAPPTPGDMSRAVRENRRYARSLGWQAYAWAIMRFLGFAASIPSESAFASAVARWQAGQSLPANGILGPQTLARMRPPLKSLTSFPGDDPRPAVSSQEIPSDPGVLRQLRREFEYEAGDQADKFLTELPLVGIPRGHKHLTERAAAVLPIRPSDLEALKNGNARVDDVRKAFDAPEQQRHTLRRTKCQPVPDALSEARNHLASLHSLALTATDRTAQFELFGEALHLIQDSYSNAHTERRYGGLGGVHPILFIRFFGFQGSCQFPVERRVVPVPDPRDLIKARGTLTDWARESVSASQEYLRMALRHLASPGSPAIPGELRAFMDRHLLLDPSHTPTTFCYPACPAPPAPCRCT
jgi:outer membrane protein OmpA-like peptidoglycan-associated protein